MKNIIKSVLFIIIFVIIFYLFSLLLLPHKSVLKYGIFKTTYYEMLKEDLDTVDVALIGDSLIYSSVVPMEIYGNYGYTLFDCATAAQVMPTSYEYFSLAIDAQHPKIIIFNADILFRNPQKRSLDSKYLDKIKNSVPLIIYHNNWKKVFLPSYNEALTDKGYVYSNTVKPSENFNYLETVTRSSQIPKENLEYLQKIIDTAKEEGIKLIFIGMPSQKAWSYKKHEAIEKLSIEYGFEYFNLNLYDLGIDWTIDTRDKGNHLNIYGAKKVSNFLGEYLSSTGLLTDHRNDINYKSWNDEYLRYLKKN